MANITDLTGTTWYLNETLTSFPWSVEDDQKYAKITIPLEVEELSFFMYGNELVYEYIGTDPDGEDNIWIVAYTLVNSVPTASSDSVRTVTFTGGTVMTDTDFISWLQENATQDTPYQQVSLNSLNIHKVPSLSLWKEQYNVGINENDLVIISPQNLEDGVFYDLKDYDLYEKVSSGVTSRELWRKNTTPSGTGYTKIGSVLNLIQGPKIKTITVPSTNWVQNSTTGNYSQTISSLTSDITAKSKIDVLPNQTIIAQLLEDGVSGIYIENNNKTVTIYAIAEKPTENLSLSVSIQETI